MAGLRDRIDILPILRTGEDSASTPPFGGTWDYDPGGYSIRSIRVDNYTERWLLIDSERFIVPPYRLGFIINLFTSQARMVIRSITPPFGRYSPGQVFTGAGKVPQSFTDQGSNLPILVSLYDTEQSEQQPIAMIDLAAVMLTQSHIASGGDPDAEAVPFDLGNPGLFGTTWPVFGSFLVPTLSTPTIFTGARDSTLSAMQLRGISAVGGGSLAVLANTWTTFHTLEASGVYPSGYDDILYMVLSSDTAGLLEARLLNSLPLGTSLVSVYQPGFMPQHFNWQPHGHDTHSPGDDLQVRMPVNANIAWSLAVGVGGQTT